jgi:hypothetical protein
MARHDPAAMSDPRLVHAFEAFIRRERELAGLLQEQMKQDEGMLGEIQARSRFPEASGAHNPEDCVSSPDALPLRSDCRIAMCAYIPAILYGLAYAGPFCLSRSHVRPASAVPHWENNS